MLRQRQIIGLLGFLLPFTLLSLSIFDPNGFIYTSISAHHFATSYLWFEGLMIAVGIFMFIYEGYDMKDKWVCRVAASGALGLALFPTTGFGAEQLSAFQIPAVISGWIHNITALTFFGMMFVMIMFQFTKTSNNEPSKKKKIRNIIYRVCGVLIPVGLLLGGALGGMVLPTVIPQFLFWGEAIALWAFGIAWLIKGKTLKFLED